MIRFRFILPLVFLLLIVLAPAQAAPEVNIESAMALSKKLEVAVDARDFHEARVVMDELLPLMKEDIKNCKKALALIKKEENPEVPYEDYEKKYNRKIELYDSAKHLIELSPAALRVKSALIVAEVTEFIGLMEPTSTDI